MTGRRAEGLLTNLIGSGATKAAVANALKKTVTGSTVRINDVSPLVHPLIINVTGTSTQSGTPTPSVPITITHSSVLVASGEHTGQYSTSVVVGGGGETKTAMIYTTEPLRQGDVWDLSSGTFTRNTGTYAFDGTEGIADYDAGLGFAYTLSSMKSGNTMNGACTHVVAKTSGSTIIPGTYCFFGANNSRVYFRGIISISDNTLATQRAFLAEQYAAGTPLTIEFQLASPFTIPVTAFTFNSINGIMTVTADGTAEVTYNRDINAAINEILTAIAALGIT